MHWHLILISTCANILQEKFFLNSCRIPLYKGHRSLGHRWGPYHDIQTSSRAFDIYNEYIWLSDLRWKDNFESMIVCLLFDIRFKNFNNYWDVSIAFNLFFLAYCYFISKSEYFLYQHLVVNHAWLEILQKKVYTFKNCHLGERNCH